MLDFVLKRQVDILKVDHQGWNLNMSSGYTVSDTFLGREIVLLPVFIILSRRDSSFIYLLNERKPGHPSASGRQSVSFKEF